MMDARTADTRGQDVLGRGTREPYVVLETVHS